MENLDKTIEKAAKPKSFTLVTTKLFYGLCAVLFVLTCAMSTKVQPVNAMSAKVQPVKTQLAKAQLVNAIDTGCNPVYHNQGSGYDICGFWGPITLKVDSSTYYQEYHANGSSPLINMYGENGSDKHIKVVVKGLGVGNYGYLTVDCTYANYDYDPVLHLVDPSGSLLTNNDDNGTSLLPSIGYPVMDGVYFIILDGTDSKGHDKNGTAQLTVNLY